MTAKKKKSSRVRKLTPPKPIEPHTDRDKLFCDRWLVHRDYCRAYREAGFKIPHGYASEGRRKLAKFGPYLDRMGKMVDTKVASEIAFERADILKAVAAIAMANPHDFLDFHEVYDEHAGGIGRVTKLKAMHTLTPQQYRAVSLSFDRETGSMGYAPPDALTRLRALRDLAEMTSVVAKPGGAGDTTNNHMHLHIGEVPIEKLAAIEAMLMDAIGPRAAREIFGLTQDDQQEALPM